MLLKGPDKPVTEPSSFRPISMLNTSGKLLERMILKMFEDHLDETPLGRAENQYGFRKEKSTTDAIGRVMKATDAAGRGPVQNRDLCILITIDVRNAFNSAPWPCIDAALRKKKTPANLLRLLRSYLQDRELWVNGIREPITCGVPQGSVIGLTLWNFLYDD